MSCTCETLEVKIPESVQKTLVQLWLLDRLSCCSKEVFRQALASWESLENAIFSAMLNDGIIEVLKAKIKEMPKIIDGDG